MQESEKNSILDARYEFKKTIDTTDKNNLAKLQVFVQESRAAKTPKYLIDYIIEAVAVDSQTSNSRAAYEAALECLLPTASYALYRARENGRV